MLANLRDLDVEKVTKFVNTKLFEDMSVAELLSQGVALPLSRTTVGAWMRRAGARVDFFKQNCYNDNHDNPAVVKHRHECCKVMGDFGRRMKDFVILPAQQCRDILERQEHQPVQTTLTRAAAAELGCPVAAMDGDVFVVLHQDDSIEFEDADVYPRAFHPEHFPAQKPTRAEWNGAVHAGHPCACFCGVLVPQCPCGARHLRWRGNPFLS